MRRTIFEMTVRAFALVTLSVVASAGESRNYWTECFLAGKKSEAEFLAYVDALSVEQLLLLGVQAAEECQRKLQAAPSSGTNTVENDYHMALGLVLGRFLQRAETADRSRLFIEAIGNPNSPVFWRKTLVLMTPELQDADPEAVRWKDYKLVSILGDVMQSSSEGTELRKLACRVAGLVLQREQKKPPKSHKAKQILSARISENVKICKKLLSDANTPPPLAEMVQETLRRYKEAGIMDAETR